MCTAAAASRSRRGESDLIRSESRLLGCCWTQQGRTLVHGSQPNIESRPTPRSSSRERKAHSTALSGLRPAPPRPARVEATPLCLNTLRRRALDVSYAIRTALYKRRGASGAHPSLRQTDSRRGEAADPLPLPSSAEESQQNHHHQPHHAAAAAPVPVPAAAAPDRVAPALPSPAATRQQASAAMFGNTNRKRSPPHPLPFSSIPSSHWMDSMALLLDPRSIPFSYVSMYVCIATVALPSRSID